MARKAKYLLLGCGGIGGIVAAHLGRAGLDVTVVTGNPETTQVLARRGIRIRELDGKEWSDRPFAAVSRASELPAGEVFDLCLAATKQTTLGQALSEAAPFLTEHTPTLCLQNGLPEEQAAAILGAERIVGCVVGFGATLIEPGFSQKTSPGGFQIARYRARPDDAALDQVCKQLRIAFPTTIVKDLPGVRWSKLAINCATSTLGALGGDTLGRLLGHRFVRRLVLEVWRELCAVADCEGVRMAKVAGTIDIAKLALSEKDKQRKLGSWSLLMKHALLWGIGLKFRRMRSSMAVAIERGRQPEVDYLNGEVVRRGERHGIPTPLNRELQRKVHELSKKQTKAGLDTLYSIYMRLENGQLGTHATSIAKEPRPENFLNKPFV